MKNIVLILCIFAGACASIEKRKPVDIGGGVLLNLPKPEEITQPIRAVQTLTIRREGKTRSVEVIFSNQNNKMALAVVLPMWPTPLQASYDGEKMEVDRYLKDNIKFDINYVLADIILVFADGEKLIKWLNAGTKVVNEKQKRTLSVGDQVVMEITYGHSNPWQGKIHLKNFVRKYEIDIVHVKVEAL